MRFRRSSARSALTLGAIAATALAWSGCDAKKQTEYVAGVSTQVQVPRDLKAIRVDVSVGGVVQFCRGYRVYDGKVQLPRSLGDFHGSEARFRAWVFVIAYRRLQDERALATTPRAWGDAGPSCTHASMTTTAL